MLGLECKTSNLFCDLGTDNNNTIDNQHGFRMIEILSGIRCLCHGLEPEPGPDDISLFCHEIGQCGSCRLEQMNGEGRGKGGGHCQHKSGQWYRTTGCCWVLGRWWKMIESLHKLLAPFALFACGSLHVPLGLEGSFCIGESVYVGSTWNNYDQQSLGSDVVGSATHPGQMILGFSAWILGRVNNFTDTGQKLIKHCHFSTYPLVSSPLVLRFNHRQLDGDNGHTSFSGPAAAMLLVLGLEWFRN